MKTNTIALRRGFTLVELLVVIVIIAALAGLTAPMVIKQRKRADHTEAINNARQMGLALFQFEDEYGSFPDDTTAAAVATATGKPAVTGASANDRFRQLFSAGMTQSEAMFYAKTSYTTKPDGVIQNDADILKAGECAFGIIMKGATTTAFSASGNPNRPICATPFANALDGTFDVDYYDGKAVILRMDNSVSSPVIATNTKKPLINGKDILDSAVGGLWNPDQPVFAFPLKKL
jgi:prepilin-type N-terminal cleavage/methylation domain-containing protein